MTEQNIQKILERHTHYLAKDVENWQDYRAIFDGLDLSNADLSGRVLIDISFQNTNLSRVNFKTTTFHDCDFFGSKFYNTDISNTTFYSCDFSFTSFGVTNAKDAYFDHCNFKHMSIRYCNCNKIEFYGCELNRVLFISTSFEDANFNGTIFCSPCAFKDCNMYPINMDKVKGIKNIVFDECWLDKNRENVSNRSVLWNICRKEYIHYIYCRIKAFIFGQSSVLYYE